jgi:hypothetical protein
MAHAIDEATARIAWNGIHMDEYKPGQATADWRAMCAECDEVADAALKRAPEREDEIESIRDRYYDRAADYINELNRIDAMCPSVLITGAGNFPTRKKQKQNERLDNFYKKDWGFDKLIRKLRIIGTDREAIKSNDADAIGKLRAKLAKCEEKQEHMKAVNAAIRLKDTKKGDARMRELGYDDDQITTFRTGAGDFCGRPGFPSYMLQNNNAEIRRIKQRIATLEKEKERAEQGNVEYDVTICGTPCHVVENADDMRLQLFFDGKPDDDTRQEVKRSGFRWARSIGAWQRQLTNNARYSLRYISKPVKVDDEPTDATDDTTDDLETAKTITTDDATDQAPATSASDEDATDDHDDHTPTDTHDDAPAPDKVAAIDEWMSAATTSGQQLTLDMWANLNDTITAA